MTQPCDCREDEVSEFHSHEYDRELCCVNVQMNKLLPFCEQDERNEDWDRTRDFCRTAEGFNSER